MPKINYLAFVFHVLALAAVIVFSAPGQAAAGNKPSPSTCSGVGFINITCVLCATGEKIGMVTVQAEYDPQYGDCMKRYQETPGMCARAYNGKTSEVGVAWSYWMGLTRYYGNYPKGCKQQ